MKYSFEKETTVALWLYCYGHSDIFSLPYRPDLIIHFIEKEFDLSQVAGQYADQSRLFCQGSFLPISMPTAPYPLGTCHLQIRNNLSNDF